jgi:hypothetical protein
MGDVLSKPNLSEGLQITVLQILSEQWSKGYYKYENLSDTEKQLVRPEQFDDLVLKMFELDLI